MIKVNRCLKLSATKCVVYCEETNEHFVVSSADVPFSGLETLVFRGDKEGRVLNWGEVAGGPGVNQEEAIEDLNRQLESREKKILENQNKFKVGDLVEVKDSLDWGPEKMAVVCGMTADRRGYKVHATDGNEAWHPASDLKIRASRIEGESDVDLCHRYIQTIDSLQEK